MDTTTPEKLDKPKEKTPWVGYIIIGIIILIFVNMCGDDDNDKKTTKKQEQKIELTKEQDDLLRNIELDGHIEIKPFDNEVYVKPLFWLTCNYKAKENLAYFCAIRCEKANNNDLYYCTVKDMQSGKKLAKYSQVWGFDVEE